MNFALVVLTLKGVANLKALIAQPMPLVLLPRSLENSTRAIGHDAETGPLVPLI